LFKDRVEAGRRLAEALAEFKNRDVVVLGIPRGGVVVANEVARALGAPLDIVVTRKIEAPGEPEYALGAVTQEGDVIMDRQAAESLGASKEYLDAQVRQKKEEVKDRLRMLREEVPYPSLEGRTVIIVDDGIATGSSIGAAVLSVRKRRPREIIVAVPVAPPGSVDMLSEDGTKVVCLETPREFLAIGQFYSDFDQVDDVVVRRILEQSRTRRTESQPP
jgi:putative phosphoribosyl transferase